MTSPPHAKEVLHRLLTDLHAAADAPALVAAVIVDGKLLAVDAVGRRRVDRDISVTAEDQFHLGSCTKAMTASLLGRLVEEGRLQWTSTLGEVFVDLPMLDVYRSVTLRQLLTHRAGFPPPERSFPRGVPARVVRRWSESPREQRAKYVALFLQQPPDYAPGEKFQYSNVGYSVAGAIAERVSDASWEQLMRKRIFEPLEMKSAGFGPMGSREKVDQPWQHALRFGRLRPVPPTAWSDNPVVIGPAGTVHCSLGDWAKFALDHLRGDRGEPALLHAATYRALHDPQAGEDYAMGWMVAQRPWAGGRTLTHSGSNTMNYCVAWLAPKKNFVVLSATNRGGDDAFKLCDQTAGRIIQTFLLEPEAQRHARGR